MLETSHSSLLQLQSGSSDFRLVQHGADFAEFLFIGPLNGQSVVWNTRLATLQSIAQVCDHKVMRQFIHIRENKHIYQLDIGLYLKQIDMAAIKRTIIMIRNYKRLRPGRHEYGPDYYFSD